MGGAIHALQERQEKNHRHGRGGKAGEGRQEKNGKLEDILAWPYRVVQFL